MLQARCYESERSLFLQPLVDAITPTLAATPSSTVAAWCGGEAPTLATVLPVVGTILDVTPDESGTEGLRRRRAFEALCALMTRMAEQAPVLLWLDDVHGAGRSTVELAGYLARTGPAPGSWCSTAARWEARDGLRSVLGSLLDEVEVGLLDREAVQALASAAGRPEMADAILDRTSGHTLYVVEVLTALAQGDGDVPESLRSAVLDRVRRAGAEVEALLLGGCRAGRRGRPRAARAPDRSGPGAGPASLRTGVGGTPARGGRPGVRVLAHELESSFKSLPGLVGLAPLPQNDAKKIVTSGRSVAVTVICWRTTAIASSKRPTER